MVRFRASFKLLLAVGLDSSALCLVEFEVQALGRYKYIYHNSNSGGHPRGPWLG